MKKVGRMLCSTDFSEGSLQALSAAKDIAKKFGSEITVIHVLPILAALPNEPTFAFNNAEYECLLQEHAQQRLSDIVHELEREGIIARAFLGRGDAASEIVRISE